MTTPPPPRKPRTITQASAWHRFRAAAAECPALARDLATMRSALLARAADARARMEGADDTMGPALADRALYLDDLAAHCTIEK